MVALVKVRAQDIYNMYIGTAEQGRLQESKWPPGSGGASVRSGVLALHCMRDIYTGSCRLRVGEMAQGFRQKDGRE